MAHSISLPRLLFLFGGTLAVLIVVLLVFYAILRLLRQQASDEEATAPPVRVRDEQAFMSGAVQGVIVDLKAKEKQLTESLRSAELHVEQLAHILDNLGAMLPIAFCVINREGLIVLWNQQFRSLLKADVWTRRHFEELFGPDAPLAALLRDCLTKDRTCQGETIEYGAPAGESKTFRVSALPWRTRTGDVGGVVCLLKDQDAAAD